MLTPALPDGRAIPPPAPGDAGSLEAAGLRAILDTMPQMVWSARPDGFHDFYNERWYEFTGAPPGSTDGEEWNGMFHREDQDRAWALWRHSLDTGTPYEIEYRLRRHDGAYRWALGRALPVRDADGRITRWFGTCTDIHDLKVAEEARELVSRELSHRIKNIFAVVTSLIGLTARRETLARSYADRLRARIEALAVAHEYVRPHSEGSRREGGGDTVSGLLRTLFVPYEGDADRITVTGADAVIGTRAATALALLFHELATNAVKYGALSRPEGRVTVAAEEAPDDRLRLTWTERGGPPIEAPPDKQGFGTELARRTARAQLGAEVVQDWAREGLVLRLDVARADLAR